MSRPNFFIIGALKCGSTSLYRWLSAHPNIYMSPKKEPHFYSSDLSYTNPLTQDEYDGLFRGADNRHRAVGEASVEYVFSEVAIPRIETEYDGARYVVLIRNPVDMAYSLHEERVFCRDEHVGDFREAWRLSPQRREGDMVSRACREPRLLDYQSICRLGEQLERLFSIVPRDRVLVLVLDDFREDPRREYLKVLEFLGVPDDGRTSFPVENPAKEKRGPDLTLHLRRVAKWAFLAKRRLGIPVARSTGILKSISRLNTRHRPRPPMSDELRQELRDFFRPDIKRLGSLLNRDFSHWLGT